MKVNYSVFKQILPKAISAFLAFWLSSVLVLVCCGSHLFTASAMEMDESCPMKKGHDCCQKDKDDKNKVSETEKSEADCCAFKPQKTLSADLSNSKNTKQSQVLTAKVETPKPVYFIKQTSKSPQVYHSAIRNRGSTYLQNCNFRI